MFDHVIVRDHTISHKVS